MKIFALFVLVAFALPGVVQAASKTAKENAYYKAEDKFCYKNDKSHGAFIKKQKKAGKQLIPFKSLEDCVASGGTEAPTGSHSTGAVSPKY